MAGGTRHYDLSRELVKKGLDVTIFASGFDHSTKRYIKISSEEKRKIETYNGVRFVWLNTYPYFGNNWRRVINMISYGINVLTACKGLQTPDVIIGSSMHPIAALAGWWLSNSYKAKFIFEVRDLWPQTAIDMGAMRPTSIIAKLLYAWEKFMFKKADKIIVLLPNAKEYIQNRGVDLSKIVWIPNGVDLERFDALAQLDPPCEVAKTFEPYHEKFKIVYLGSHGIPNGLDVIIDAAAIIEREIPNIQFMFIGEGTEKKRLISKANTLSLQNIAFCNAISKQTVPSVLRLADCLIVSIPNFDIYKYGVSLNKLFDYCASGKPIILAGNPVNNIVKEANAGIAVETSNPEALANAIINMFQMSEKDRQQLGENGRLYIEKYHTSAILGEKLFKTLQDL